MVGDSLSTAFHRRIARQEFFVVINLRIIMKYHGCEEPGDELAEGRHIYYLHAGVSPVSLLTNLLQKAASLQLAAIVTCRLRKH